MAITLMQPLMRFPRSIYSQGWVGRLWLQCQGVASLPYLPAHLGVLHNADIVIRRQ